MFIDYNEAQCVIDGVWDDSRDDGGLDDGVLERLLAHDFETHPLDYTDGQCDMAWVESDKVMFPTDGTEVG